MKNEMRHHYSTGFKAALSAGTLACLAATTATAVQAAEATDRAQIPTWPAQSLEPAFAQETAPPSSLDFDQMDKFLNDPKIEQQLNQSINLIEEFWGLNQTQPLEESRLPAAQLVSEAIISPAIIAAVIDQSYGRISKSFEMESSLLKAEDISHVFGLDADIAQKISAADLLAIAAVIDPYKAERSDRVAQIIQPVLQKIGHTMAPPLLEGQSRALAKRFTEPQLAEIQSFFASGTGKQFAEQLWGMSMDDEMLRATFRSIPLLWTEMKPSISPMMRALAALPQAKDFDHLNDADLRQIAKILKIDAKKLKAGWEQVKVDQLEIALAEEAAQYPEEAYDRVNWSEAQRTKVEALEAAQAEAEQAVLDAETEAIKDASQRIGIRADAAINT